MHVYVKHITTKFQLNRSSFNIYIYVHMKYIYVYVTQLQ